MTWFYFCFDFVRSRARCDFCSIVFWRGWGEGEGGFGSFKIGRSMSRGGKILNVDGQRGCGSWKLDNFHGRHMCIVLNVKFKTLLLYNFVKNYQNVIKLCRMFFQHKSDKYMQKNRGKILALVPLQILWHNYWRFTYQLVFLVQGQQRKH